MKLSIIIPCYNEAKTIRAIVERVRAAPVASKEIIIVDDCSRDGSRIVLEELGRHPGVRVFRQGRNRGKGAALHRGFWQAPGPA